ncbi:MAG: cytochrome P460 family protein [Oligoflexales bacterium]
MQCNKIIFAAIIILYPLFLSGENHNLKIPSLKNLREMNGVSPGLYDNFWINWKLVSVRFREDNREQRFIYANEIAYESLKKGRHIFPDGSVFGKVAFKTKPDRNFPNSLEPYDFSRLQLMVKDRKKYSKSDGWSYWLYLDNDKLSRKKDKERFQACHACHTLVEKNDFIFTTPTFFPVEKINKSFSSFFKSEKKLKLSLYEKSLKNLLKNKSTEIFIYRMPMFSGSQYESIGPLSKYANEKKSYMIIDPKTGKFLLAEKMKSNNKCQKLIRILLLKFKSKKISKDKSNVIREGLICNGKNTWVKNKDMPRSILKLLPER